MLKPTSTVYICSLHLFAAAGGLFGGTSCAQLEGTKPEAQLAYLQRDRKELDGKCILFAIGHLGTEHYVSASKTLVKYLDYPAPEDPRSGQFFDHVPMLWNLYPASTALFSIGEATVPDIVAVIADAETSDLIRSNAILVLPGIYSERPPEGVAVVARAASELSKSDAVAGSRLWEAARKVAASCGDRHKTECYAGLIQ